MNTQEIQQETKRYKMTVNMAAGNDGEEKFVIKSVRMHQCPEWKACDAWEVGP